MCAIRKRLLKFMVNPNDEDRKTIYLSDIDIKTNQWVRLKNRLPKDCLCKVYKLGTDTMNHKYPFSTSEILGETGNLVRKDAIVINNIPTIRYTISVIKNNNQTKKLMIIMIECTKDLIDKRYKPTYHAPKPTPLKLDCDYLKGYVLDGTL